MKEHVKMSVAKRKSDGKWLVNIKPGGRSGTQIKRVFSTQAEAKNFERWVLGQHQQNKEWTPSKKDERPLSDLLKIWFAAHGQTLASGKDSYARMLAVAEIMQDPPPAELKERFDEYRQYSIEEGKSLATINREHAYIRAVFNELTRLGRFEGDNPLKDVRQFKVKANELAYLREHEIPELLGSLKDSSNPHTYLISKIALCTGGRWSECEKLTIHQLQGNRIQFARTKSGKTRAVPISSELKKEISDHRALHPTGTVRIFESSYGAFISALERTTIRLPKGQASHVLRHTFASHFMIKGGNILTLQRALGHSSLEMTMRYAHLAPDHMQQVLELNPLSQSKASQKL